MALKLKEEYMYTVGDLRLIFRDGKLEIFSVENDLIVQPTVSNSVKVSSVKLNKIKQ